MEESDVEMAASQDGEAISDAPSIIKINYDLSSMEANKIEELPKETAEQHFGLPA